eukprot:350508-Chlamydomonas_euryale.AAC.5
MTAATAGRRQTCGAQRHACAAPASHPPDRKPASTRRCRAAAPASYPPHRKLAPARRRGTAPPPRLSPRAHRPPPQQRPVSAYGRSWEAGPPRQRGKPLLRQRAPPPPLPTHQWPPPRPMHQWPQRAASEPHGESCWEVPEGGGRCQSACGAVCAAAAGDKAAARVAGEGEFEDWAAAGDEKGTAGGGGVRKGLRQDLKRRTLQAFKEGGRRQGPGNCRRSEWALRD